MRRGLMVLFALTVAMSLGLSAAYAGPGCCAAKKKDAKVAKASCGKKASCGIGTFPAIARRVGDKTYDCPATAEKMARKTGSNVVFVVGEESFDTRNKAVAALALAAEGYVDKFTTIACVVDGKLVYCDEKAKAGCGSSCHSKVTKASAKTGCSKTCGSKGKTVTAKAGCSKTCGSKGKTATAKAGCSSTCGAKGKKAGGGSQKSSKDGKAAKDETQTEEHWRSKGKLVGATGGRKDDSAKAGTKGRCDGSKCEKFLVVGREFDSYKAAVKARDAALAAVAKIRMTTLIDGEALAADAEVCPNAKAAGKVRFVVNGTKTGCEYTARVSLAQAKYDAAKAVLDDATEI